MYDALTVESHRGPYTVSFSPRIAPDLFEAPEGRRAHFIIDERLPGLYPRELSGPLGSPSVLLVEACEANKSLEAMPRHVAHLLAKAVRRDDVLFAVGGGIIQDIACFLSATFLRGLDWHFVPTTLLAQADSCIGSKSSINAGDAKNILGTFTPPRSVRLSPEFLRTLTDLEIRSGIGEMLKVHAIEAPGSFDRIAADYPRLASDRELLLGCIRRSLDIKRRLIELDEFDRGPRRVMNYGHTFGHALESATAFAVPHGIAVTIGMDMANFIAARTGRMPAEHFQRMRPILASNYSGFEDVSVPLEAFLSALGKDKKNTRDMLGLILPDRDARPCQVSVPNDPAFRELCAEYFRDGIGRAR